MDSAAAKVLHLRQILAERLVSLSLSSQEFYSVGLETLDEIGIPRGALTEIVAPVAAGPGSSLLLYALLHAVIRKGDRAILIDGKDAFAPKGLPQAELNRLLWTRCRNAGEAIKSADLILRDGNIPLVILLLTLTPAAELRRIPATAWHRLQMLAEKSGVSVLVFSPHDQVGCARLRIAVGGAFPLEKLHHRRTELLSALTLRVERRRIERRYDHDELRRAACA